ncbi:hypothetical protein AX15_005101, partial [Amanita polypyramis BW_CC]
LVWSGIAENLSSIISVWWEDPEIVKKLNAFRRALFVPLVDRLGFEYKEGESPDITALRTCAIGQAALAGDEGVVRELKNRFAHYIKTGDDSNIPADLLRITYRTAVRYGGTEEYEAMQKIHDKPQTPTARLASILGMGATEDPELIKKTFDFIMNKSRDQDTVYFFRGLEVNFKSRRALAQFFKDQYDALYKRFESNFMLSHLVSLAFGNLSTQKDYEDIVAFFKDKDTSKYNLSLAQAEDSIRSRAAMVERSTNELRGWERGK